MVEGKLEKNRVGGVEKLQELSVFSNIIQSVAWRRVSVLDRDPLWGGELSVLLVLCLVLFHVELWYIDV